MDIRTHIGYASTTVKKYSKIEKVEDGIISTQPPEDDNQTPIVTEPG
jgi:hypothetical protein